MDATDSLLIEHSNVGRAGTSRLPAPSCDLQRVYVRANRGSMLGAMRNPTCGG
jgi:hypothetical protein